MLLLLPVPATGHVKGCQGVLLGVGWGSWCFPGLAKRGSAPQAGGAPYCPVLASPGEWHGDLWHGFVVSASPDRLILLQGSCLWGAKGSACLPGDLGRAVAAAGCGSEKRKGAG